MRVCGRGRITLRLAGCRRPVTGESISNYKDSEPAARGSTRTMVISPVTVIVTVRRLLMQGKNRGLGRMTSVTVTVWVPSPLQVRSCSMK